MNRILLSALMFGALILQPGCSDEAKVKTSETVSTPGGLTTTTTETKVQSSGSKPPANSDGETAKTAAPK